MTRTFSGRGALRLLVLLWLAALLCVPARAAGESGSFYNRHSAEFVPDGRSYRTNGPEG